MVAKHARRLCRLWRRARRDELESAGYFALVASALRFDEASGEDFEAFAAKRVYGTMLREATRSSYSKAMPRVTTGGEGERPAGSSEVSLELIGDDPSLQTGSEAEAVGTIDARQACAALRGLAGTLPPTQRAVLEAIYDDGATLDEAATQVGSSKKAVRGAHDKAKQALGRRLLALGIDPRR